MESSVAIGVFALETVENPEILRSVGSGVVVVIIGDLGGGTGLGVWGEMNGYRW